MTIIIAAATEKTAYIGSDRRWSLDDYFFSRAKSVTKNGWLFGAAGSPVMFNVVDVADIGTPAETGRTNAGVKAKVVEPLLEAARTFSDRDLAESTESTMLLAAPGLVVEIWSSWAFTLNRPESGMEAVSFAGSGTLPATASYRLNRRHGLSIENSIREAIKETGATLSSCSSDSDILKIGR